MRKAKILVAGLVALSCALTGCAQVRSQGRERTVTVLAAASLTESFEELASRFSAEHPGVHVQFDFQGSSTLAEQVDQGRKADVFASANTKNMDKVVGFGGVAEPPKTFATNQLTMVVPAGNPARISSLADLAAPGRTVVVCAPQVPCGSAAEKVERSSGVRIKPASEENDVKSVLRKVVAGEADAGLVYVTDARSAGDKIQSVAFPQAGQATNTYPIAPLKNGPEPELAKEFVAYVHGPVGKQVLAGHGFGTP